MNRDTPQSDDGNQESGGALKAWQWWHPPTNAGNRPDIQAPNQGNRDQGCSRSSEAISRTRRHAVSAPRSANKLRPMLRARCLYPGS